MCIKFSEIEGKILLNLLNKEHLSQHGTLLSHHACRRYQTLKGPSYDFALLLMFLGKFHKIVLLNSGRRHSCRRKRFACALGGVSGVAFITTDEQLQ